MTLYGIESGTMFEISCVSSSSSSSYESIPWVIQILRLPYNSLSCILPGNRYTIILADCIPLTFSCTNDSFRTRFCNILNIILLKSDSFEFLRRPLYFSTKSERRFAPFTDFPRTMSIAYFSVTLQL